MNDFLYNTEDVKWGREGSERVLTVRGLSTQDLTITIRTHKDSLTKAFELAEGRLEDENLTEFGLELMEQFPGLVAQLIALAADKPDKAGEIGCLPAPVQLRLMLAVYELTIEDTGGLQDFLQQVFAILNRIKATTHSLSSKPELMTNTST